jgi:superfamily II DNA helicase RecQ
VGYRDSDSIYINADNKTSAIVEAIKDKVHRRVYLAPEQLQTDDIRKLCKDPEWTKDVIAYIIDEAHVVLQWGGTFRPVYQTRSDLRHIGGRKIPIMPLTVTLPLSMYH